MDLDITPAFIDIFTRINKHLDQLPFQKLLNDQNSTLTDEEKQSLKNKMKESTKKIRQLNLVLDELKDQLMNEIEQVNVDFEEKNHELDALEGHLNNLKLNQLNKNKTSTTVLKSEELDNNLNNLNDLYMNGLDQTDDTKKENMNKFMNQQSEFELAKTVIDNPSKKILRKPTSHLTQPNSQLKLNGSNAQNSMIKKSLYSNNKLTNQSNPLNSNSNNKNLQMKNKPQQIQQQQSKKEKNVDNIYINYPQVNYISLSEFNYIPQYMRGRLNFEMCNKLVDEFNKTVEIKYKFMMIPTSKYTNEELIKYTLYKGQEDDETRGLFFVTPKDLHDHSMLKISMNNTKIFIQCARHCKRIKEIRGIDKLIRYVVLN